MADVQKLNVNNTTYDISTTWSKVTGKPSTFPPESHTHSYLPLSGGTMSNQNVVVNLNADLLDGYSGSAYAKKTDLSSYLPLSGGTMTGAVTMNTGTGLSMKYTASSTTGDRWIYPTGADSYGIRYFEGNPDKMTISATGNNTTIAGADLCINGNGDGTVTVRGKTIYHTGNLTKVSQLTNDAGYKTTDTNTWRPVTNTYTGSDQSTCVSQYGTNALYNALVNGYASSAGTATYATNDVDGSPFKTTYLRKVTVANNAENDFNSFSNMTLTGRGDPTTGASLKNAPWTGAGPAGGYGVLTYLWSGYGTQMAWGYNSNRIYIRNKYYSNNASTWSSSWGQIALTSDIPTSLPANGGASTYASRLGDSNAYYTKASLDTALNGKANSSHGTHVSGTSFSSGSSGYCEHNCNSITSNGHWYYNSNGPSGLGETFTDGALYSQAYSSSWVAQIAQDYRNGNLFTRGKNNGTWTAWKAVSYAGHTHSGYAASSHTHTKSQITDFPSSMPASDVYSWAKAASKPTYTAAEVGAATSGHTHSYLSGRYVLLNRASYVNSGLSFYASSYNTWQIYMSAAGATGCGINGNVTAPTGSLVTSWGLRSVLENSSGYGWTWESMANNGTTPTIQMELSSSSGNLKTRGTMTATGFYQSSDERLKTFYDPIKVDLENLRKLRKNYFKFNDKDKLEIGVSAQEIQTIYPEIVSTDDEGYLSVAYDKLSIIALAALDEQQKEIDDLKDQLKAIKNILTEKGIL